MIEFNKIVESINKLYGSQEFKRIYKTALSTIDKYLMSDMINQGVLLGFSGGADSVMALLVLNKLKQTHSFNLVCLHVNHGIRGNEADSDELFSKEFCEALRVGFVSRKLDVPEYAKDKSMSLELAARELRYSEFESYLNSDSSVNTVVTAHNSTDNLETVIFNLARGSGAKGISGISPVRNNIIRPLICVPKRIIIEALDKYFVPYVTDSTNKSDDYSRNYIRHNVLPKLYHLNDNIELAAQRLGENLRIDSDYLDGITHSFFEENYKSGYIERNALSALHPAIFARVLPLMTKTMTSTSPEKTHIDSTYSRLSIGGDFSIDIQAGLRFVCENNKCRIIKREEAIACDARIDESILSLGVNVLDEFNSAILLSYDKKDVFSSNVYKFSTQASLPDDIIIGDMKVRQKKDGDSYVFGGMTRKLKKLFNDKKIPVNKRNEYPVICDDKGILFLPGFPIRDNSSKKSSKILYVSIYSKDKE